MNCFPILLQVMGRLLLHIAILWQLLILFVKADYYEDLELTKGEESTDSEIKKAYRILTKKYHPGMLCLLK